MKLCVIPARGGSKRIPNKNIKEFCGKPIIGWSIEAAIHSGCFDKVIVSTDDENIANIAISFGAEVPFFRPVNLADDYTGTVAVIQHATKWVSENWQQPDYVCCVYATAPFVRSLDITLGYEKILNEEADYVFSVASFESPIQRAIKINSAGRVEMMYPEHLNSRSQDLEEGYYNAGQFYWGTGEAWLTGKRVLSGNSSPIIVPRGRVQDIDTLEDWEHAELLFNWLIEKNK
jgi:N-acylneuraminate cytidylyltransferase